MDARFSRTRLLVGEDAFQRLTHASVTVVGLGAVGSYAVEGLARAGIGHLRLVDFDSIQISNINRQLYALDSTIGMPKCDVAAQRVKDINPECVVESLCVFAHKDTFSELFMQGDGNAPDYVIDAVDSLTPKVEMMVWLREMRIPFISCMGAALRHDPSQIRTGTLDQARGCPLARMIRKRLRNRKIPPDMMCVYSTEDIHSWRLTALEKPACLSGAFLKETQGVESQASARKTSEKDAETYPERNVESVLGEKRTSPVSLSFSTDAEPFQRGRIRSTLGSLPTLTGIFGLTLANWVIHEILQNQKKH